MTTHKTTSKTTRSLALCMTLWLAQSSVCAAERFSYSADGSEVTDNRTGLVWRRCSEGQSWSGSNCTGSASTYTHEGALQRAQTQSGWRLPNVKELSSLVDDTRINPAINTVAFPNTPHSWFWTSSPFVGDSNYAWLVIFYDGSVYVYVRDYDYGFYVRLVR